MLLIIWHMLIILRTDDGSSLESVRWVCFLESVRWVCFLQPGENIIMCVAFPQVREGNG